VGLLLGFSLRWLGDVSYFRQVGLRRSHLLCWTWDTRMATWFHYRRPNCTDVSTFSHRTTCIRIVLRLNNGFLAEIFRSICVAAVCPSIWSLMAIL